MLEVADKKDSQEPQERPVAFFIHVLDVVNEDPNYEWKYVHSCIDFSLA
jgi:hypothetical protein